jgi:hypothetical protein
MGTMENGLTPSEEDVLDRVKSIEKKLGITMTRRRIGLLIPLALGLLMVPPAYTRIAAGRIATQKSRPDI